VPFYDYICDPCGAEFETFHKMTETPRIVCPKCGAPARKVVSACGIIIRNTGARRASVDRAKLDREARADLKENFGVEKIHPVGGQSLMEVYNGVKSKGAMLRDQMQQKREENAKAAKAKQREWAVKANRRVARKTLLAQEMRAKEAAEKSAITL
jgi:putative FmdB family regulatory protein